MIKEGKLMASYPETWKSLRRRQRPIPRTWRWSRFPGSEGELGVYPNHVPVLTTLNRASCAWSKDGKETSLAVGEGFVEITGDRVSVLTDMALEAQVIDEAAAEKRRRARAGRDEGRSLRRRSRRDPGFACKRRSRNCTSNAGGIPSCSSARNCTRPINSPLSPATAFTRGSSRARHEQQAFGRFSLLLSKGRPKRNLVSSSMKFAGCASVN